MLDIKAKPFSHSALTTKKNQLTIDVTQQGYEFIFLKIKNPDATELIPSATSTQFSAEFWYIFIRSP